MELEDGIAILSQDTATLAMASDDVLVVGTGFSDSIRNTALRVTDDGGVFLGRAQGDISMGSYQ